MVLLVPAWRCSGRISLSLLWLTFAHREYSSCLCMLGPCRGCYCRVTFVLSQYQIKLLLVPHMLLQNLISLPPWNYGSRLGHLCCWAFNCYYRFCRGYRFHGLLADHWWYQSRWTFIHLGRWYSLACSRPWLLLLYWQLDVHAPHLTDKTSSAINAVALLDGMFILI